MEQRIARQTNLIVNEDHSSVAELCCQGIGAFEVDVVNAKPTLKAIHKIIARACSEVCSASETQTP